MRLKETKSNWNASNLIRKMAIAPDSVRTHARKNTKMWCKGKVGTFHEWGFPKISCSDYTNQHGDQVFFWASALYVCENCGKHEYISLSEQYKHKL